MAKKECNFSCLTLLLQKNCSCHKSIKKECLRALQSYKRKLYFFLSASNKIFFSTLATVCLISSTASALAEMESTPCLTKNSAISALLPACPQIDIFTLYFLQTWITLDISPNTAGCISLNKCAILSLFLSIPKVS